MNKENQVEEVNTKGPRDRTNAMTKGEVEKYKIIKELKEDLLDAYINGDKKEIGKINQSLQNCGCGKEKIEQYNKSAQERGENLRAALNSAPARFSDVVVQKDQNVDQPTSGAPSRIPSTRTR